MKRYRAAIFDMDGTLLDTLDDLWDAVNYTMDLFSYPRRSREEVRCFVGNGVRRLLELCVPGGRNDPHLEEAIQKNRAYYTAHAEIKTKAYDGVPEGLERLRRMGIGTAIVSNKPHEATQVLAGKYFPDVRVVCGEQEKNGIRRKPYPDMVFRAVEELGVPLEDCVYIGDSEVDLRTAEQAGMDVISVLWGFRDRDFLEREGARVFVSDMEELLHFFPEQL